MLGDDQHPSPEVIAEAQAPFERESWTYYAEAFRRVDALVAAGVIPPLDQP